MRKVIRPGTLTALAFAVAGCDTTLLPDGRDEDPVDVDGGETRNLLQVATDAGTFTTLLAAVDAANLSATLTGRDDVTVFAPTDAAFELWPDGAVDALLADPTALEALLSYHVASGTLRAADLIDDRAAATAQGGDVRVAAGPTVDGGEAVVNGLAQVIDADIDASNGVIHVIDAVLVPPGTEFPGTLADAVGAHPILSDLSSMAVSAGFDADLEGWTAEGRTLFAPQDTAFGDAADAVGALPSARVYDVLRYHMLPDTLLAEDLAGLTALGTVYGPDIAFLVEEGGDGVVLNGGQARVVGTDLRTNNGVLHVIDGVLLPPELAGGGEPTE